MKTIKYIFLGLVSFSFFYLTSCSSLQNMPYDDVYYSQDNQAPAPVNQQVTVVDHAADKNYQQGKVVEIDPNTPVADTVYDDFSDQSAQQFYDNYATNNDCNCDDQSNFSLNLGFGNAYFGSSPWDWSFYGFNTFNPFWRTSFYTSYYYNPFYYDPYFYDPYYSYYGFSGYYPYYYGSNVWMNNPYFYNNYYFNYGNIENGYRLGRRTYQVRHNRFGGSALPRSVVSGSAYAAKQAKRAGSRVVGSKSAKRVPVNPEGRNGRGIKTANQGRPQGSVRYQKDAAQLKRAEMAKRAASAQNRSGANRYGATYNRSGNYRNGTVRSSGSNIPASSRYNQTQKRYQKPAGNKQVRSTQKSNSQYRKPRYQKPVQYQRIDARRSSNPKVYYRTTTRRPARVSTPSRVKSSRPVSVKSRNVYRPIRKTTTNRSVYRPSTITKPKVKVYSRPVKNRTSSSHYSAPARTYRSTTTRTYSAPSRSSSFSSSSSRSSGSGSVSRTTRSGGGIRK